jgi:hypothetical protein
VRLPHASKKGLAKGEEQHPVCVTEGYLPIIIAAVISLRDL